MGSAAPGTGRLVSGSAAVLGETPPRNETTGNQAAQRPKHRRTNARTHRRRRLRFTGGLGAGRNRPTQPGQRGPGGAVIKSANTTAPHTAEYFPVPASIPAAITSSVTA